MKILFFDTETTGFAKPNLSPCDKNQAHITQLAIQLVDDRNIDEVLAQANFFIEIGEAAMNPKAQEVHGRSPEFLNENGLSPSFSLRLFHEFLQNADAICAHNIDFDINMIGLLCEREMIKNVSLKDIIYGVVTSMNKKPHLCTMELSRDILKIPPTDRMISSGFYHFKNPNLSECSRFFFNEEIENAHDAMADVTMCRRVYSCIKQNHLDDNDSKNHQGEE